MLFEELTNVIQDKRLSYLNHQPKAKWNLPMLQRISKYVHPHYHDHHLNCQITNTISPFMAERLQNMSFEHYELIDDALSVLNKEPSDFNNLDEFESKKKSLLKRKCRVGYKPYFYEVSDDECIDLDNHQDFKYLEFILK